MKTILSPKGNPVKDYSGERFGKLVVTTYVRTDYKVMGDRASADAFHIFECLCSCGKTCEKSAQNLRHSTQCPTCGFQQKNAKLSKVMSEKASKQNELKRVKV